jgi:uncharacterized RDD family membrane protein YckC
MEYEDRITIPTPEGVSLEMTLAGLGSRIVAGGVDLVLKALLVVPVLVVLVALLNDLAFAVAAPLTGLLMIGYDVAFETLAGGRTPGKRWSGLRVVRSSGRPVDLLASSIRNLMRLVDGLLLSYVPTFISILVTKRNQRPGDLAANTVVIRDRRGVDKLKATAAPAALASGAGATWDVSAIPADEVATVRAFLERREGLTKDARERLAKRLASGLRPRVAGADEWDPERFLEILYEAKQGRG